MGVMTILENFSGSSRTSFGHVLPNPVLTIKEDVIVIDFRPQKVDEDCSHLKSVLKRIESTIGAPYGALEILKTVMNLSQV